MITDALKKGLMLIFRSWKIFFIYYIFVALMALILILPASYTIIKDVGLTVKAGSLIKSFTPVTFIEIIVNNYPGLLKFYLPYMLIVLVLFIMGALFLSGGALSMYTMRKNSIVEYFTESIAYFGSILRGFLLMIPFYILAIVIFFLLSLLRREYIVEKGWEMTYYIVQIISLIVLLFLLNFVSMLFDYLRITIIASNEKKVFVGFKKAFSFVFSHSGKTLGLFYLISISEFIFIIIFLALKNLLATHTMFTILLYAVIAQLGIAVRIMGRLLTYASQQALYQNLNKGETTL